MTTIKKLDVISFAILLTVIGAHIGMAFGLLYSFGGLIIDILVSIEWVLSASTPGLSSGTALAFLALIGMPAIGAMIGFAAGVVGALLFNFTSKWLGGVEMDFN